jgi:hypothetical protein
MTAINQQLQKVSSALDAMAGTGDPALTARATLIGKGVRLGGLTGVGLGGVAGLGKAVLDDEDDDWKSLLRKTLVGAGIGGAAGAGVGALHGGLVDKGTLETILRENNERILQEAADREAMATMQHRTIAMHQAIERLTRGI